MNNVFIHESAFVDLPCNIGEGTKIWHFSHIMKEATIGERCNIGQNVLVASGVVIGSNVKIQNNVSIYQGTEIDDDVFLGPSCVLTNVTNPRSQVNRHDLYEKIHIRRGATIGANATIVCGIELGRYCFIGAGAVVTRDVPDYALMVGTPAKQKGWMSRHGHRLQNPGKDGIMICPESGYRYQLIGNRESGIENRELRVESRESSAKSCISDVLRCLDLDEDAPLPAQQKMGKKAYREYKA
jgi:UDP-2-acetamido-3-amino-2,3-dideoxy-glucuronate N-acetyltransferase